MDLDKAPKSKNFVDRRPQGPVLQAIDLIQRLFGAGKYDPQLQYDIEVKRSLIERDIREPFEKQYLEKKRPGTVFDSETGLYSMNREVDMILADLFKNPDARPLPRKK